MGPKKNNRRDLVDNQPWTTTEWGEVHETKLKECDLSQKEHETNRNECDLSQKNLDVANAVRSESLSTVTRKERLRGKFNGPHSRSRRRDLLPPVKYNAKI